MTCCVCQDNRFSGLASYHFGLVLRLSRLSNYWDYPDYTDRTSTIRLIRVIPRISYYLVSSPFNRLIKLYATSRFAHRENRLLFDVSVYPCQSFRKIDKNSIYETINISLFTSWNDYNDQWLKSYSCLGKIKQVINNCF